MVKLCGWGFGGFSSHFPFHWLDCQTDLWKPRKYPHPDVTFCTFPDAHTFHPSFFKWKKWKPLRCFWVQICQKEKNPQPSHILYKTNKNSLIPQIRRLKKTTKRLEPNRTEKVAKKQGNHPDFPLLKRVPCCHSYVPEEASHMQENSSEKQQYCLLMSVVEYKAETKAVFFFPSLSSPFYIFLYLISKETLPYPGTEKNEDNQAIFHLQSKWRLSLWL